MPGFPKWLRTFLFVQALLAALGLAAAAPDAEIFVQAGHKHWVQAVAVSPDGRLGLSGSWDRAVILWDLVSGREIRTFRGHANVVTAVAFAPGMALSADMDGNLRYWDLESGAPLRTVKAHKKAIYALTVSPDGHRALTSSADLTMKWWDLDTGRTLDTFSDEGPKAQGAVAVRFSPDGRRALAGGGDGKARLWDLAGHQLLRTLEAGEDSVWGVAFLPDGSQAMTGCKVAVKLWNLADGRELRSYAGAGKGVLGLAVNRDGSRILAACDDHTLALWDVSGPLLRTLTGHAGSVNAVAFLPDGRHALSGAEDTSLRLWDVESGQEPRILRGASGSIAGVAYAPDGRTALSAVRDTLVLWDLATGREKAIFHGHTGDINALALSADGRLALSGGEDKLVKLWDVATGKELRTFTGSRGGIQAVALSRDGRIAASSAGNLDVTLWDVPSGKELRRIEAHGLMVTKALAFSPDGARLVTASWDKQAKLWDVATGQELRTFKGHEDALTSVAFGPDGRRFLTGSWDGTVRLWDVDSSKPLKTLRGHKDWVFDVAFTPDGAQALSVGFDGTMRRWDLAAGRELQSILVPGGRADNLSLSADGRRAVTGGQNGAVIVWDLAAFRERARLISFEDGEWIAITPDAYFDASGKGAAQLNVRIGTQVFGVDQFYGRYFRPERVQAALAGQELPKGPSLLEVAGTRRAPSVAILAPASGAALEADHVRLELKITDEGGGIGDVQVYLNGSQVANDARGVAVTGVEEPGVRRLAFDLPLAPGLNEIKAVALNREGSMESVPALAAVRTKAAAARGVLRALVVGINTYRNQNIALRNAVADAQGFRDALEAAARPLFGETRIRLLTTPEETSRDAIVRAFEELRAEVRPEDLFVFYDASHGVVDQAEDGEQYFLLTSNVLLLSSRHIAAEAIGQRELARLIGALPAQKKLVFLDTCNAGRGGRELQGALLATRGLTDATAAKVLQRAIGSAVFASSADTQEALEGYQGHGLFTFVLLEGLKGKADLKKDGFITVLGLADYVEEEVVTLSERVFNRQQTPTIQTGANFPIGKVP